MSEPDDPQRDDELGRKAFEGAKAVDPNAWMTPAWEDLGAARQRGWIAAAKAVLRQ